MQRNYRVSAAVAAILASHASGPARAEAAADTSSSSTEIAEVTVTATRRTENLQDVPIAITALTAETLKQLNVSTLDDFVKYLPNVSTASKGPGQNEVYMRGLSTTQNGNQGSGSIGSFPNVAIYLDDQSVQLPGRNLDVYAVDIERIEVLEGPQGTLYGAGAQAGAVRYITNKPKLNTIEAIFAGGYAETSHGDPSHLLQAIINLPLIEDKFALRAVVYEEKRGGYIHNIPGTFAREPTDGGIAYYFGGVVPPGSPTLSNAGLVNHEYNPVSYKGSRFSALFQFNENWSIDLQQSFQTMEADGVFSYAPALGDLNIQQYNPSYDIDKFKDTAWTLNGQIGPIKAVYTGGYLSRTVNQQTDYTAYARGALGAYYQCDGPSVNFSGVPSKVTQDTCYSPSSVWYDNEKNTHQSHELRFSTPDNLRARGILGLFYEDYKIQDSINWQYGQEQAGFAPFAPLPGTTIYDPSERRPGTVFFNDITRGYTQHAIFGEFAYDIVPTVTLTLGTRLYRMDNFEEGSKNSEYGCRNQAAGTCSYPYSVNLNTVTFADGSTGALRDRDDGHKDKVNLAWKVTPDAMVYATYSEGFRPGGFNRGQGVIPPSSPLYGKFVLPYEYQNDTLKNYEVGWKTVWFNHRLQFNGALYQEDWSNVQMEIFAPEIYGNNAFTANGPNYRVRGLEGDLTWRATEHLTVNSSFAWNTSEQRNVPQVYGSDGVAYALFPTAGIGSPLAQAPPFQGNIRARYEDVFAAYNWHVQAGAQHTAHSYASTVTQGGFEPPNQPQDAYTTYDAAAGISREAWDVEFYGENLTDTRAQLYVNGFDFVHTVTPNRPRTYGLKVTYSFSKHR